MKFVVTFLFAMVLLLIPSAAMAKEDAQEVILNILALNCEAGLDECYVLNDAYIRVESPGHSVTTRTDENGIAFVIITVDQVPSNIDIWLNNEVLYKLHVPGGMKFYAFTVDIAYFPKVLFLPQLGNQAIPPRSWVWGAQPTEQEVIALGGHVFQPTDHSWQLYCSSWALADDYDGRCTWLPLAAM